jgi:hypothetical protein
MAIGTDDTWSAVLADRTRLEVLGAKARKLAEEQFSFDIMAARYEAVYQSVLSRR